MPTEVFYINTTIKRSDLTGKGGRGLEDIAEAIGSTHERIAQKGGEIVASYQLEVDRVKGLPVNFLYLVADIPEQLPEPDSPPSAPQVADS